MQQRATFKALKCSDPAILAVKVAGHLGTRQRKVVDELVRKCGENNRNKVIFEFAELESLGGVIAAILGRFSHELTQAGTPPLFVACNPVVRSFLQARFPASPPSFADTVEQAEKIHAGEIEAPDPAAAASAPKPEPAPEAPKGKKTPAKDKPAAATPTPPTPPEGAAKSKHPACYSLPQAERLLAGAETPGARKEAIAGLLYGANLADHCYLLHPIDDRFVEAEDDSIYLSANGELARLFKSYGGPIPIVDITELKVAPEEADMLTRINCQMGVPLIRDDVLQGILFFRKGRAGDEYDPGETLALDLMARLWGGSAITTSPASKSRKDQSAELKQRAHRNQTLARLGRELNAVQDEEQLMNLILLTLMSEMGVGTSAFFSLSGGVLRPRCTRGVDATQLTELPGKAALDRWTNVKGVDGEDKEFGEILGALKDAGFDRAVPLSTRSGVQGLVALGPARGGDARLFDETFLKAILDQSAVAVANATSVRQMHQRTLQVARTILSLAARRGGLDEASRSDRATCYVGRIARQMNYPSDQIRDLIYGTVLRDVGMIEISDLVLRSPRRLSPEEWKLVQRHPLTGAELLTSMGFGQNAADIVLHHHERFNGEGYPNGLRANAIPLGARIVAVVESYLAMTRDLPYRAALSKAEAVDVIRENWELRYDPEVVEAFVSVVEHEEGQDNEAYLEDLLAMV